ncbi:Uncharacterised protein [Mycobacteroides abscessus subsp. abscessus]|nr:Uncharacterised protein [Mycobacteroides abscessus subsp. abscessus]
MTPGIGPGFPNQTNILINLGQANIFAFPIEITLSYRASNTPTSGALTADWDGMPNGISAPQVITMPTDYVTDIDGKYRPAANMSTNCVSTFGQQGDEYDTCQRVASDEVTWVKANMLTGPLCQPVTHNSNTAFLPSNGNRYCR